MHAVVRALCGEEDVAAVDAKAAKGGLHSHRRPEFGLAYPGEEGAVEVPRLVYASKGIIVDAGPAWDTAVKRPL